ncbi:hypothetical protein NP233_g4068 [Leucocoprinus birnbaumii]|uniref:Uncharacterized protein n=1 Tax=Leucocoprinus birnbaumii TaxID=56174 RepID=A0AAD5VVE0_9AGAR|nr:hypothetical protein NP233_g4068 [Leucocoprinus birnbaumii]
MGLVSSTQAGATSSSAEPRTPSRLSKPSPPEVPEPAIPLPANPEPSHPHHTPNHRRIGSATEASTKLKERRAWYHHLKRDIPVSERKAKKSAVIVRSLIVGQPTTASPKITRAAARPQLIKVKSRLTEPKSANRIIAQLRTLSPLGDDAVTANSAARLGEKASSPVDPIHAVCLEHPDAEMDRLYFSKSGDGDNSKLDVTSLVDVGSATMNGLFELMNGINVIDLVKSPDLGLGQPGDGPGVLAGALPTPETVSVYPPTDRMSVLTYWWGLELVLPPPSLAFLSSAHSVSGSVMNFLTALSMVNNGVREILPFIRYISQFVDFEFNQIKGQDQGKGVICAATWIMPAALVPRPWDFADPPIPSINPPKDKDELKDPPESNPLPNPQPAPTPAPSKPSPTTGMPFLTPVPVTAA